MYDGGLARTCEARATNERTNERTSGTGKRDGEEIRGKMKREHTLQREREREREKVRTREEE